MQYPLDAEGQEDIFQKRHEGHESFMKAKAESVLGRGDLLDKVLCWAGEICLIRYCSGQGRSGGGAVSNLVSLCKFLCHGI